MQVQAKNLRFVAHAERALTPDVPAKRSSKSSLVFAVGLLVALAGSANARELTPVDALATVREKPDTQAELLARAGVTEFRGHFDSRLGVPTFFWAPPSVKPAPPQAIAAPSELAARNHLAALAPLYRSNPDAARALPLLDQQLLPGGASLVRFGNTQGGIEVFREHVAVLMKADGALTAVGGFAIASDATSSKSIDSFALSPTEAVARVLADFAFIPSVVAPSLHDVGDRDGYSFLELAAGVQSADGATLAGPARAKPVYFRLPSGLVPAYYVEVQVLDTPSSSADYFGYVVSARSGETLFRHSQTADAPFNYRVWADGSGLLTPLDGPHAEFSPHPTGVPDGSQPAFVLPSLVNVQSVGISTNAPWLADAATQTSGNNVDAYADFNAPDGFSNNDLRATTTAGVRTFDRTYDTALAPDASPDQRMAAVTQLFYVNNWLHDSFYDAGFNEASGNAQAFNGPYGGLQGDALRAEGQDFAGLNNANMSTPADGFPPRMQMFIFSGSSVASLTLTPPGTASGNVGVATGFGAQTFDFTANVVLGSDGTAPVNDGCQSLTNVVTGLIVLIDRGSCVFTAKAANVQAAGGVGMILADNQPGPVAGMGGAQAGITIAALRITQADGNALKASLLGGPVSARMQRSVNVNRDGTIDNTIIAHEWGHYISNRLVGDASGLSTIQSLGMGEGWGDFHGLMMLVRNGDNLGGVFGQAGYVFGGPVSPGQLNNSYYFGFRRYPYSTNLNVNPLTFRHIEDGVALPVGPPRAGTSPNNSQVHNTGEVWASMLWECYSSLLAGNSGLTFAQAQDRMKRYLVAGYKLTPNAPTFVEARDAILAAALASSPADFQACGLGFAKRGNGTGSVAPDRFSTNNAGVVESFVFGGALAVESATVTDNPGYCDADGFLDNAETGTLTVTLRNSGHTTLSAVTASVSSADAAVVFPSGTALTFPPVEPFRTTSATIPVSLTGASGPAFVTIDVMASDPSLGAPVTGGGTFRVQLDEVLATSATDSVEARALVWTRLVEGSTDTTFEWRRSSLAPDTHVLLGPDPGAPVVTWLMSPPLVVAASGDFTLNFSHRHRFEAPLYDGGVIEISTNGGSTWTDIGTALAGYTGVLDNTSANPLGGRDAFVNVSAGYPAFAPKAINFGPAYAGTTVQIRFGVAADINTGDIGWEIDDVAFGGITNTPFTTVVAHRGLCASASATQGTPQSTQIGTAFPTALVAQLLDSGGLPRSGVSVQFVAPASGASGTFAGGQSSVTVVTDANGNATAPTFTANATTGSYQVVATATPFSAAFALTNLQATSPSGVGAAAPSTVARGASTLLTVNVTPGASPASSGIAVVANLSSIGSGTAQAFFDDGITGGDLSAGDGIWSLRASVAPDTVAGVKSLAVTITDAQGRSGATDIGLTVSASTAPSGIGAASPATLQVGAVTLLTVTATPGTSPGSTGIGVVSNLVSIGGNVAQTFYDDGTNGDLVAGNNVFSFSITIAVGTSEGAKSLPVSIADAQLRTASSNIGLTVVGPSVFGSGFE